MKKPAKPRRSKIIKDCDILWSKIVRQRDGHQCTIQGCENDSAHAHHIFSRKNISTRFDLQNGVTLCFFHHFHFAHTDYEKFRDWVISWMGLKEFEALKRKANRIEKFSTDELVELKSQLKRMVDE